MKSGRIINLIAGAALLLGAGLASATSFHKQLALQGISFDVTSPNSAAGNTVRIFRPGCRSTTR